MDITFNHNGIYFDFEVMRDGRVALWNCSDAPRPRQGDGTAYLIGEVQGLGCNQNWHHGQKQRFSSPGDRLRYVSHTFGPNCFQLIQQTDTLKMTTTWQFYAGVKALRSQVKVENIGQDAFPLEYVASFALTGLAAREAPRSNENIIGIPHNSWYGESQWQFSSLKEAGYDEVNVREGFGTKRIALSSTGNWPSGEYLPMGAFLRPEHALVWQIESPGGWQWEIGDVRGDMYLMMSGPSFRGHQFLKQLQPGEAFAAVPCALAFGQDFNDAMGAMTRYRRRICPAHADLANPSVIFNDYMNCLMGDPTTEKEIPMIDAAAALGCKYYCIDAGWYDDGPWWDGVGEWLPARRRFTGGLKALLDYIRGKGMIPGLWLEIESMGIRCPLGEKVPPEWFFSIQGRRIVDERRWQLDFRNPDVRAYADGVIRRLVEEYGAGYIKMDYNINPGVGTDHQADSPGEGALAHQRAYLSWLDAVLARYPRLIVENCASGGMRMEYAHLSRSSIQSVTDQTDYIKMASIACNCMTALLPEQAAIWSYPMEQGDEEETIFNMVNAMLLRIHQSGHLVRLSPERLALVKAGVDMHLAIIRDLKQGLPFWPIGLSRFGDEWMCVGNGCGTHAYIAVWHTKPRHAMGTIPLDGYTAAECIYPPKGRTYQLRAGKLQVALPGVAAAVFKLYK